MIVNQRSCLLRISESALSFFRILDFEDLGHLSALLFEKFELIGQEIEQGLVTAVEVLLRIDNRSGQG